MFSPGGGGAFLPDEEDAMLIAQQHKTIDQQQQEIRALKVRMAELEGKLGNTHICSRYVPEWALKEGIRELIQNFFDACVRRCVELQFNTELIQVKHQQFTRSGSTFRNFWVFTNQPGPPTILGIIQYDPDQELLTIKNPGFIAKGCLLLGGGNKENDPKCAGKFGEGLKLAILALLRLDRDQVAPATSAAASASSQPPRPALERQSSGEPVVSAAAAAATASAKAPPLAATNFGGLPARANPNKMTVKIITPMGKDAKKSEKWDFWLQKAAGFPAKDGTDEHCVFFESTPVAFDPSVTVQVFGLKVSDWNAQIRNYRRLTDQTKWLVHHGKWPDRTPWGAEDGGAVQADYQGYVMLHPDQAGRLYVKGIHVADSNVPLGFDFDALSVDRDRKHITDYWGQCKRISFMVTGILNRIEPIKKRYAHLVGDAFRQGGQARDALDRLWKVAFAMLRTDNMRYAYLNASQSVADRFFTMWQKEIGEPPGVRPDGAPYTMPVQSKEKDQVLQFLQQKGMSLDAQNRVYPCRIVDWRLGNMLYKSNYYKKVEVVYEQLAGNVPTDSAEVVKAKKAFDDALKILQALTK